MGLLDTVLQGLVGGSATSSPIGPVLSSLLGGSSQQGGSMGGLGGLVARFAQAGLGSVAQSWVSNGPNQAVSPQQLRSVFGEQHVQGMASQAGMEPNDFLSQLSQYLPHAVNGMTPNGRLPDEDTMSV
jgi:uncharacterized protein YidB (DUF937 family)